MLWGSAPPPSCILTYRVLLADNRLRLIGKHFASPDRGYLAGAEMTYSQQAAVVLASVDARDFLLKAADINNIKRKYVDCLWKRAERDVESVFLWVRTVLLRL